jgi:hypothetical protein
MARILDLSQRISTEITLNAMHWIRIGQMSHAKTHQTRALLAATMQVGLFWICFSRFHFASSIHLCNGFLKLFLHYPQRIESNSILRYDVISISIALKQHKETHMDHILTQRGPASPKHMELGTHEVMLVGYGLKRDGIGYWPCSRKTSRTYSTIYNTHTCSRFEIL